MLTGMIGKYETNLLGKKYLIPNTLKEWVENFKSLPRYCPVMEKSEFEIAELTTS